METKSRLFTSFDLNAEQNRAFPIHLRTAVSLGPENISHCISALAAYRLTTNEPQRREHRDALHTLTRIGDVQLEQVMTVLVFFLNSLLSDDYKGESSRLWAEDLVQLEVLGEDSRSKFVATIDAIRERVLPKVSRELTYRSYATGNFPCIDSCGTTVEMRAVKDRIWKWGEPLDEYTPRIVDTVPVALVHIGLDEGNPKDLYFQATEESLQFLIENLQVAQKDLRALQRHLANQNSDDNPN